MIDSVVYCFVSGWLLVAAWSDRKSRRVTNRWCLFGLGAAAVTLAARLAVLRGGFAAFADSLFGALLAGGILLLGALIRRGGIGMGDVKVFFVLGLFLGTETVFAVLLITLVAALLAGAVQILRGKIRGKDRLPLCPYAYVALIIAILSGL